MVVREFELKKLIEDSPFDSKGLAHFAGASWYSFLTGGLEGRAGPGSCRRSDNWISYVISLTLVFWELCTENAYMICLQNPHQCSCSQQVLLLAKEVKIYCKN